MTGINWRDAVTQMPTEEDVDSGGFVAIPNPYSTFGVTRSNCPVGKWCPVREVRELIEPTVNQPGSQLGSPWVYAKDRMPTEEDGKHVLWMADSWTRPVIHPFYALRLESSRYHRHNLRWCRIPPCPKPPKRELPAKAVNKEECPCKVTLRDGDHAQAVYRLDEGEGKLWLVNRNGDVYLYWWSMEGKQLSFNGGARSMDIVHVGGWLTAEELEALKNG